MNSLKIFFSMLLILLSTINLLGASITVSGPTSAIMDAGTTTKTVRYNITYNPGGEPWTSSLHYRIDGGSRIPSNYDGSGANNPSYVDIALTQGSHTITFEWMAYNWGTGLWYYADTETKNIIVQFKVFTKNNFGSGSIKVDNTSQISGFYKLVKALDNIGLEAIEQYYSGYNYIWNSSGSYISDWGRIPYQSTRTAFSNNKITSYSVISSDNYTTIEAGLRKICLVSLKNQHSGGESGGNIYVNNVSYTSPTSSFNVVEQNKITGKAENHTINGIYFTFQNWTWSGGSSSNIQTDFYPNVHNEYKAVFSGKPLNAYRYQSFNSGSNGTPIIVYWNQHPNSNVTKYGVYRKVGKTGVTSLIGTVNRTSASSYSFTDPSYVHTNNTSSDNLLWYDIRAYYGPDGNYSDADFRSLYGEEGAAKKSSEIDESSIITYEYGINNYPNPFNPTSTINYSIKEIGNVNITIYDALGRKVKELVNEIKTPGSYEIKFDGTNLSSGIYIYTMNVNNFFESKKMILAK